MRLVRSICHLTVRFDWVSIPALACQSAELGARLSHVPMSTHHPHAGLVMLGDDMAASLIEGLPESLLLAASRA